MAERTNFDAAAAELWQKEVDQEFDFVRKLLAEVSAELQSDPANDDPTMAKIIETGEKMEQAWNELEKQFRTLTKGIAKIAADWKKRIQENLEKLGNYAKNFHLG